MFTLGRYHHYYYTFGLLTLYVFSPYFPTPRRSLFTSNLMSGMEGRGKAFTSLPKILSLTPTSDSEYVTTPPIPTSSPFPIEDLMDVSPLPHKVFGCTQIPVDSPTPASSEDSEEDSEMSIEVEDSPAVRPSLMDPARHALEYV